MSQSKHTPNEPSLSFISGRLAMTKGTEILFRKHLKSTTARDIFKNMIDFIKAYVIMWEKFSEIYSDGTTSKRICRALLIILTKPWLQMQLVHCGI